MTAVGIVIVFTRVMGLLNLATLTRLSPFKVLYLRKNLFAVPAGRRSHLQVIVMENSFSPAQYMMPSP
jgi:hypothetical protein